MLSCASTRAAAEHFCPAYPNADDVSAGTTSSRSASASTITQFLPPISDTTRFTCRCSSGVSAAARTIGEPDGARARERDRVDAGMPHERLARVAEAGQQRDRAGRDARLAQRGRKRVAAGRGLLGRLQHHGVAGRERRGGHPAGDRDREVPRRDHRRDAASHVAHRVALTRHLQELVPAFELDRLTRVVLEEVDRLADVRVRLSPRLRAFAHLERGQVQPVAAQEVGGAHEDGRPLFGRCLGPGRRNGGRRLDRSSRLGGAGAARDRDDPSR